MIVVAVDGDNAGSDLEQAVLEGEAHRVREVSSHIRSRVREVEEFLRKRGGDIILVGGDNILATFESTTDLTGLWELCVQPGALTFSVGLGGTLRDAWMALKYAKTRKPAVVSCDDGVLRWIGTK